MLLGGTVQPLDGAEIDSGDCGTDVTWSLSDTGVLTVAGMGAMGNYTAANLPEYSVHVGSITDVVISDGVTRIGNYAFSGFASIETLTIGEDVASIGQYAFDGCTALETLTIPDSVASIGSRAFRNCTSLTELSIGKAVGSLGVDAFYGSSLASVIIREGATAVSENAFSLCPITSLDLPDSMVSIGTAAFFKTKITSLIIPEGVKTIGGYAFYMSSLTSLVIPNTMETISAEAFSMCKDLRSIWINNSTVKIGHGAFVLDISNGDTRPHLISSGGKVLENLNNSVNGSHTKFEVGYELSYRIVGHPGDIAVPANVLKPYNAEITIQKDLYSLYGYEVSFFVNNNPESGSFLMTKNTKVTIVFTAIPVGVNITGDGYTIVQTDSAVYGEAYTFSVRATPGFRRVPTITVDGEEVTASFDAETGEYTYTIASVTKIYEVSVTFSAIPVGVNITGEGYDLAGGGSASYGEPYTISLKAKAGFQGAPTITVDDEEVAAVTEDGVTYRYVIANVTKIYDVAVNFAAVQVGVNIGGEGYEQVRTDNAEYGEPYTFTIRIADGYEGILMISLDGGEPAAHYSADGGVYMFIIDRVTGIHAVTVTGLVPVTYAVTIPSGSGYVIDMMTEADLNAVAHGSSVSFTLTITIGYEGTPEVMAGGTILTAVGGLYTIDNITSDVTVIVTGITPKAVAEPGAEDDGGETEETGRYLLAMISAILIALLLIVMFFNQRNGNGR